jgi:hypothetical protein
MRTHDGAILICRGIQRSYFYPAWRGRLLWGCWWALTICWRLDACVGVRDDELRQGSTLEWVISSELLWPTSESVRAHAHTHSASAQCLWEGIGEKGFGEWDFVSGRKIGSNLILFVTCAEYNKCISYPELLTLQSLNQQCSSKKIENKIFTKFAIVKI